MIKVNESSKIYFEQEDGKWFLTDGESQRILMEQKKLRQGLHGSKAFTAEWNRAIVFRKMLGIWDITGFGANMSALVADAVTKVDGEFKLLVFSTIHAAEKQLFPYFDLNFKRKCLRRAEEFYQKKEYQTRITFDNPDYYNDHVLRPIVLLVAEDGTIESILRHKELLHMEIYPNAEGDNTVWLDKNRKIMPPWILEDFKKKFEQQSAI